MRLVIVSSAWVCLMAQTSACSPDAPSPQASSTCDGVELIVAASDLSSSMVCGAPPCELGPRTSGVDLGKDPQLAVSNGRMFFLARDNDLIFELDPVCGTPLSRFSVHEEGIQGWVNPHDVAAAPDGSVFVALYNAPRIAIFKDGKVDGTIDLSSYDPDGNPQAESIRIVAVDGVAKAFVTLERLDDLDTRPGRYLQSKQPSFMLRIDVASRTTEAVIPLEGRNPFNAMIEAGGELFLSEPGNFNAADEPLAGIERFSTTSSTTKLIVAEKELGGSVAEVAVTNGCGVAIVAGPAKDENPTSLVTFDPKTGQVFTTALNPVLGPTPGYDLWGLAWRGDVLYVGDRRREGLGYPVHIFERESGICNLHEKAQGLTLPQKPVALRGAL